MTRVWRFIEGIVGCKYLVVRRDGTIPTFPTFVLGGRDPWAPAALRAYANLAKVSGADPAYVADIFQLAIEFEAHRQANGEGDPDGAPHREDNSDIIALMADGGQVDFEAHYEAGFNEAVRQVNEELELNGDVHSGFVNAGLNTICVKS